MACENNKNIKCPCGSAYCERHGKCCECVAFHKKSGDLPSCLRKNI